ncbi:MAG TPA: GNAT family N-acetyltransferase [Acidimicrobiales bacterium]|jgi:GNAT superfamily N-acetyltransferase
MATVRPARAADAPFLREIERQAGERFRDVGMAEIADHDPPSPQVLAIYANDGRSWVAIDGDQGAPVGYTLVDLVDGAAHIEQISVLPEFQGQGVGQRLLAEVRSWAAQTGRHALTLTTFAEVPWNQPLYEHLGFRVLTESELGPELRAVRDAETAHGLDPTTRVCMRLEL